MRILVDRPCCAEVFDGGLLLGEISNGKAGFSRPSAKEIGTFTPDGVYLRYCPKCGQEMQVLQMVQDDGTPVVLDHIDQLVGIPVAHWGPKRVDKELAELGISRLLGDVGVAEVALVTCGSGWRRSEGLRWFVKRAWSERVPVYILKPDKSLTPLPPNAEVFDA